MKYSNPTTTRTIEDWPYGRDLRTTAMFYVENKPGKGQRAVRRTVDPKTLRLSNPKAMTYAARVRFVDGDDGKLYILEDSQPWGFINVMQSNMKFQAESIFPNNDRYAETLALFEEEEK